MDFRHGKGWWRDSELRYDQWWRDIGLRYDHTRRERVRTFAFLSKGFTINVPYERRRDGNVIVENVAMATR